MEASRSLTEAIKEGLKNITSQLEINNHLLREANYRAHRKEQSDNTWRLQMAAAAEELDDTVQHQQRSHSSELPEFILEFPTENFPIEAKEEEEES